MGEPVGSDQNGNARTEKVHWAWIGNRSPLMSEKEEAHWVLERLINRLERELENVKRKEVDGRTETEDSEDSIVIDEYAEKSCNTGEDR